MARQRLPDRRIAETFELKLGGLAYTVTLSRFPDGRLGELFLTNHKANSAADQLARDAGIGFSIAIQSRADPQAIRRALGRDSQGNATSPLGAALDIITETSRGEKS